VAVRDPFCTGASFCSRDRFKERGCARACSTDTHHQLHCARAACGIFCAGSLPDLLHLCELHLWPLTAAAPSADCHFSQTGEYKKAALVFSRWPQLLLRSPRGFSCAHVIGSSSTFLVSIPGLPLSVGLTYCLKARRAIKIRSKTTPPSVFGKNLGKFSCSDTDGGIVNFLNLNLGRFY
jgi:hypothetical protein